MSLVSLRNHPKAGVPCFIAFYLLRSRLWLNALLNYGPSCTVCSSSPGPHGSFNYALYCTDDTAQIPAAEFIIASMTTIAGDYTLPRGMAFTQSFARGSTKVALLIFCFLSTLSMASVMLCMRSFGRDASKADFVIHSENVS
jgi:hypothetical protein